MCQNTQHKQIGSDILYHQCRTSCTTDCTVGKSVFHRLLVVHNVSHAMKYVFSNIKCGSDTECETFVNSATALELEVFTGPKSWACSDFPTVT